MLDDLTEGFDDPFDIDQLQPLEEEAPEELDASVHEVVEEEEVERPMFLLERIYPAPEPDMVQSMAVANGTIVMLLDNNRIIRRTPRGVEEIAFKRGTNENATKIFVDPSGAHIFITTESARNYYYQAGTKMKAPKLLEKWRLCIESMAFLLPLEELRGDERGQILPLHGGPHHADPRVNWGLLVGTQDGRLIETTLELRDKTIQEVVPDSMFDRAPISGIDGSIDWEAVAGSGRDVFPRYYIVCAASSIKMDFVRYSLESPMTPNSTSVRLPFACDSWLQFSYLADSPWFAWASGSGVYHGPFPATQSSQDALTFHDHPTGTKSQDGVIVPFPRGLAVTAFHYLTLYEDRLQAWCHLSEECANENIALALVGGSTGPTAGSADLLGGFQAIATDAVTREIWVASMSGLFRLATNEEDRLVWSIFLTKARGLVAGLQKTPVGARDPTDPDLTEALRLFRLAVKYAKTDIQRDYVMLEQAEAEHALGRLAEAARTWAKTTKPFEEVVLRLMPQRAVLKAYLEECLMHLKQHLHGVRDVPHIDQARHTLLSTWIIEIQLARYAEEEFHGTEKDQETARDELMAFLLDSTDALNREVTYSLLSSHGRSDLLVQYAKKIHDTDCVVGHCIQEEKWADAIKALSEAESEEFDYKYGPTIIKHEPKALIESWIRKPRINPVKLLPALMNYEAPEGTEPSSNLALAYLHHCIERLKLEDVPIHNYMFSCLARLRDEDYLLDFIARPRTFYDPRYALRVCMAENNTRACVCLYNTLGLYEEAVELALAYSPDDPELAKDSAQMASQYADEDITKRLWVRIAQRAVERHRDSNTTGRTLIQTVFDEVDDRASLVRVEDVLPFFPDHVAVEDFRDEIEKSLRHYNEDLIQMKEDMDRSATTAESVRKEIRELRNRYRVVTRAQRCIKCGKRLFAADNDFFVFPCKHCFHHRCLRSIAVKKYSFELRDRVERLLHAANPPEPQQAKRGSARFSADAVRGLFGGGGSSEERAPEPVDPNSDEALTPEQAREKLEAILASECPMCGGPMISSISDPFLDPFAEQAELRTWALDPDV